MSVPSELRPVRPDARIRRARPEEAGLLSALARRSKAHWDYDPDFLRRAEAQLTVTSRTIVEQEVWVLQLEDRLVGFHQVVPGEPSVVEDLWLEPEAIGLGLGRCLWEHAVEVARASGASSMELDAEPNALGFYERMGAVRVGETPSSVAPGRSLPRMRVELDR
jgi:GNAT superfamily N-acetyltransferase